MDVQSLEGDVWPFLDEHAAPLIREYFHSGSFTGARFEQLGGGGDAPEVADRFTSDDLVAITLLRVEVSAQGALRLLDGEFNADLAAVPAHADLTDNDCPVDLVADGSPAARLWGGLRTLPDVGWVTAHKLCARKRPRLLPVYDAVLKEALQPNRDPFWVPLWATLRDRSLVRRLAEVRSEAGLDENVSLLRVLDVSIWMRNRGVEQVPWDRPGNPKPLPFGPASN